MIKKGFCNNTGRTHFKKGHHYSRKTEFKKGMIPFSKTYPELMPRGENHPQWKGGTRKRGKYIMIYQPNHPFCDNQSYVMEHRFVMEKHLGKYLNPKEIVHHINGIKTDNRIENLMLFASNSKHSSYHTFKNERLQNG